MNELLMLLGAVHPAEEGWKLIVTPPAGGEGTRWELELDRGDPVRGFGGERVRSTRCELDIRKYYLGYGATFDEALDRALKCARRFVSEERARLRKQLAALPPVAGDDVEHEW